MALSDSNNLDCTRVMINGCTHRRIVGGRMRRGSFGELAAVAETDKKILAL